MTSISGRYLCLLWLVMLCAGLAYSYALQSPLFYDDLPNLAQNPLVQIDGSSFDSWRTAAFSNGSGPLRRPISMVSFAANYTLFGTFSPVSLKAVNVVIHLIVGGLIYWLALLLFRSPLFTSKDANLLRLQAFAASAIWLLHPLHVSTVMYAVQRMAQLSTLFTVLGLCVFLQYRLRWADRGASVGQLIGAALWLVLITGCATLSKENGALLPWLILVLEVTLFRGIWAGTRNRCLQGLAWVAFLAPFFLLALILQISPETFTAGYHQREFSMVERLMTQSRLLWHYLGWLYLPDIRAMGFQHDDISVSLSLFQPGSTLYAILAWLITILAAALLRQRYPLFLFAVLFFLVAHMMESTLLALEMVYEHRNYLPSVGLSILGGCLISYPVTWRGVQRSHLPLGFVLVVLWALLVLRCQIWSSQFSLAQANVINHPSSARAQYMYATALMARYRQGDIDGMHDDEKKATMVAARKHFLRMHDEAPESVLALVMLLYVDSYFFSGLVSKVDWEGSLEKTLQSTVFQATDFVALSFLLSCVADGGCFISPYKTEDLLGKVIQRHPGNILLLLSKYKFLESIGAPNEQRLRSLDQASVIAPGHPSILQYRILERKRSGDIAGIYEVLRVWLVNDSQRRQLPLFKPFLVKRPDLTERESEINLQQGSGP